MNSHPKGRTTKLALIQRGPGWSAWCHGDKDVLKTPSGLVTRKCEVANA
ncbi:hypothetical protein LCGC14_2027230 [marine sediment metagenome]|uniref:Uncharacterized protein n=1 Tax=marine sediment metagenome TaxID=412755 RepID=A0A0F9H963_9ZZZZ